MHLTRAAAVAVLTVVGTCNQVAASSDRWYQVAGGTWKVSSATSIELMTSLSKAVSSSKTPEGTRHRSINEFVVQYQGVHKKEQQLVQVSGACDTHRKPNGFFETEWLTVSDGGSCYFNAVYDPRRKKVVRFWFNGLA